MTGDRKTDTSRGVETDTAEGWIDNPSWVNVATVKRWLAEHDASFDEFVEDQGDQSQYRSNEVFEWLGY